MMRIIRGDLDDQRVVELLYVHFDKARLSLETGARPYFQPAQALYRSHGFVECGAFGDYAPDPDSVFMTLALPAHPLAPS